MNTSEYCNNLEYELTSWRNRLSHVTSKMDSMPSIDKFRLTEHIEGLHILLTELDDRINLLQTQCETSWKLEEEVPVKADIGLKNRDAGVHHDYDFGG